MKTSTKKITIISVWLLTVIIVIVTYEITLPLNAAPKSGRILPYAGVFYLSILGVVVQGILLSRGYFHLGSFSVIYIGTIVIIPIYLLMISLGEDDFWLMAKWLFIPCYSATLVSYLITELRMR